MLSPMLGRKGDKQANLEGFAAEEDWDIVRLCHHGNHGASCRTHAVAVAEQRVCCEKHFGDLAAQHSEPNGSNEQGTSHHLAHKV